MRTFLIACLVALAAERAPAQFLDLGGGTTSPLRWDAAGARADRLASRADARRASGDELATDLLDLAAGLYRAGLDSGEPERILLARRYDAAIAEIERRLTDADGFTRARVRGSLESIDPELNDLWLSLRNALSHLLDETDPHALGPTWVHTMTDEDVRRAHEAIGSLQEWAGEEPNELEQLERLGRFATFGISKRAYWNTSARLSRDLVGAVTALRDPPGWVETDTIDRARALVVEDALLAPGNGRARAGLRTLARIGAILERVGTLELDNDTRALRETVSGWLLAPPGPGPVASLERALDALDRLRAERPSDREIRRSLRPSWRWASREARLRTPELVRQLPALAGEGSSVSDPNTLSALRSAADPADMLDAIESLTELLELAPEGAMARLDEAMLRSGVPSTDTMGMRAEGGMGGAGEPWLVRMSRDLERAHALSLSGTPPVRDGASQAFTQLVIVWSDGGDPSNLRRLLGAIERVRDWTRTRHALELATQRRSLACAWPGFALSPGAARQLLERVDAGLARASGGDLDDALDSLDDRLAPVLVLGDLERALRDRTGLKTGDPAWSVLGPLARGPADPALDWMGAHTADLALLSAGLEELADAMVRDDRPAIEDITAALGPPADRVRVVIDPR